MIVKALILSLLKKKAWTLLLLFSIAACSSLIFANAGFQASIREVLYSTSVRFGGDADIYITVRQSAGSEEWINTGLLAPYAGQFEYTQELVRTKALHAPNTEAQHYFTVLGTDIDEFNSRNPLTLQSGGTEDWAGDKLIMSAAFADRLGVSAGGALPLEVNGETRKFQIAGTSRPTGLFTRDIADGGFLLMPRDTAAGMSGGECNLVFLKLRDPSAVESFMQTLADELPQYSVNLGIDRAVITAETNNFVMPFWFSSLLVVFMSVFIIYSSFNLIVIERIKILGILRSVGCSRRKTNVILLSESMAIGLVGGAIGCMLGSGVLFLIRAMFFSGNSDVAEGRMVIGAFEVTLTLVSSMILTVISAMLPIFKVTRMPVKGIIQGDYQKEKLKSGKHWIIGLALIAPAVIVPYAIGQGMIEMIIASVSFTLALAGLILVIPALCRFATRLCAGAPPEIMLGVRNAGDFKSLMNNTRLFGATIAIMVVMTTLFNTLGNDISNLYRQHPFDIQLELRESNPRTLEVLRGVPCVADSYGEYRTWGSLPDYGTFLNGLVGIGGAEYFGFFHATSVPPETVDALNNLKGNEMVTTYILRDKLGLKIGDTLRVQLDEGAFEYVITGFLDTNWGIGHMGYISEETFKTELNADNYSSIYIKTDGSPDAARDNILRAYTTDVLSINTKRELEQANADKVMGVFNAINAYAYFATLIGFIGIVNNMAGCFLGRRRNIAMYRCVGMTRKGTRRMLTTEAAAIGIIGMISGLLTGILVMGVIPLLTGMFFGNVAVAVPYAQITVICGAGMAAMLVCSIIPTVMGGKISIMDNIRYE